MKDNEFTVSELARRIGVCSATVQRWCRDGRLPGAYLSIRHGRVAWLIPDQTVSELIGLRKSALEEKQDE